MPVFYDVDLSRAKLGGLARIAATGAVPGLQVTGVVQTPAVETLGPFEVAAADLPDAAFERMSPVMDELAALGFHSPIFHTVVDKRQSTRTYRATFLHSSGRAFARLQHLVWNNMGSEVTFLEPKFFSALDDGSFLMTETGKPRATLPEAIHPAYHEGLGTADLWAAHGQELSGLLQRRAELVIDQDTLRAETERLHAEFRDMFLERGIFRPRDVNEVQPVAVDVGDDQLVVDDFDVAVLREIDLLQKQRGSWASAFLTLLVSLALFVGLGGGGGNWMGAVWPLLVVLLIHELGHYVAMRGFGYSNLKMFFIPFFGAAVSGKHYNVAGWKKAVVALAGPVPGIFLGIPIGLVGLSMRMPELTNIAMLMMFLNGFNLLPLLPLDGGWVMHAIIFSRHPLLDALFRLIAAIGMLVLAVALGGIFLGVIAFSMLLSIPTAWTTASVAHRLRGRRAVAVSPDSQSIPPQAALTILGAIRSAMPRQINPKMAAQFVVNIFGLLNARPPGAAASLLLIFVHVASFVVAFLFAGFLVVAQFAGKR